MFVSEGFTSLKVSRVQLFDHIWQSGVGCLQRICLIISFYLYYCYHLARRVSAERNHHNEINIILVQSIGYILVLVGDHTKILMLISMFINDNIFRHF